MPFLTDIPDSPVPQEGITLSVYFKMLNQAMDLHRCSMLQFRVAKVNKFELIIKGYFPLTATYQTPFHVNR